MAELATGQRAPLAGPVVELNVDGPQVERRAGQMGAVLVATGIDRKLSPSFAPINALTREMRPGAQFDESGALKIDLATLPPDVEKLSLILYIVGGVGRGVTFRDYERLVTTVGDYRYTLELGGRAECSLILIEIYRRNGDWRIAANGQGFAGGLGAAGHALGVDIATPDHPDLPDRRGGGYGDPPPRSGPSSGSGFAIERHHILTNSHVIEGVRDVTVASERGQQPAEIVFADPRNDVALLRVEKPLGAVGRFRFSLDLDLGEDIVVLGFPLQGLLGAGPQVTGGNVSSLCGIGNDTGVLQFTAPIASGNSGGPILDMSGLIVGQVHASLNKDRIREGGGSAENINFGSKAPILRTFLAAQGLSCTVSDDTKQRSRADIVREARSYLYRVNCDC